LRKRYEALLAGGEIERDAAQDRVVQRFDSLLAQLDGRLRAGRAGPLARLFRRAKPPIRGLYVWGDVGRGKTMLMDLFFASLPTGMARRRVHFNEFMNDVHERIFRYRSEVKAGLRKGEDPIAPVADDLARDAALLCFDEFSVTDIADAMILGRLFTRLFGIGVTVVATSNVAPDKLYQDGLNRSLFLPFIDLLKEHMEVVRLDARTDYRLEKLSAASTYVVGSPGETRKSLDAAFLRLTGQARGIPRTLQVKGRTLAIPEAAMGVARFSFAELCERPLGPADYLALAEAFHTIVLDGVPVLATERRNEVKRFITLIDSLYDRSSKLVVGAAAEPGELYRGTEGKEAFEFQRTASRLIEMRSTDYLGRAHNEGSRRGGIVET
jgi:cell division protein ZapE